MADNVQGRVAFFWDESHLWGLIAYYTFRDLGVHFDLLTSEDVRGGTLNGYDVLFVPGGWACDKMRALGEDGAARIREFVSGGGGYLGFCGGAGLALTHESGLGLAPVGRMPSSTRVPSFSGLIGLSQTKPSHPMWKGMTNGTAFYAWWPGQFALDEGAASAGGAVDVLARYGEPEEGVSYVTDIPVTPGVDWDKWEKSYGVNLDPARLKGEPAVIETTYGSGRVILSYLHFESRGDFSGHAVLINLLGYLAGGKKVASPLESPEDSEFTGSAGEPDHGKAAAIADEIHDAVSQLITFGSLNFLWKWRVAWILQWRRGVKGIEYSTIFAMMCKIRNQSHLIRDDDAQSLQRLERLRDLALPFVEDARRLLMLERFAMNQGPLSPLKCDDPEIQAFREKLFSSTRRCGGLYREIVELEDEILLPLLKEELGQEDR